MRLLEDVSACPESEKISNPTALPAWRPEVGSPDGCWTVDVCARFPVVLDAWERDSLLRAFRLESTGTRGSDAAPVSAAALLWFR